MCDQRNANRVYHLAAVHHAICDSCDETLLQQSCNSSCKICSNTSRVDAKTFRPEEHGRRTIKKTNYNWQDWNTYASWHNITYRWCKCQRDEIERSNKKRHETLLRESQAKRNRERQAREMKLNQVRREVNKSASEFERYKQEKQLLQSSTHFSNPVKAVKVISSSVKTTVQNLVNEAKTSVHAGRAILDFKDSILEELGSVSEPVSETLDRYTDYATNFLQYAGEVDKNIRELAATLQGDANYDEKLPDLDLDPENTVEEIALQLKRKLPEMRETLEQIRAKRQEVVDYSKEILKDVRNIDGMVSAIEESDVSQPLREFIEWVKQNNYPKFLQQDLGMQSNLKAIPAVHPSVAAVQHAYSDWENAVKWARGWGGNVAGFVTGAILAPPMIVWGIIGAIIGLFKRRTVNIYEEVAWAEIDMSGIWSLQISDTLTSVTRVVDNKQVLERLKNEAHELEQEISRKKKDEQEKLNHVEKCIADVYQLEALLNDDEWVEDTNMLKRKIMKKIDLLSAELNDLIQ